MNASKPSWSGKDLSELTAAEWRERADLAPGAETAEHYERMAQLCDEENNQ